MKNECSIIIPHRHQPEKLRLCLDRLVELGYVDCEIIVVDNGESAPDYLNKYPVKVYTINTFPSPYIARNLGIEKAENNIIVLLDANCLVEKGWMEGGLRVLDENAIVSGIPVKPNARTMDGWQKFDYLYSSFSDVKNTNVKALPAGSLFFYKSVWDQTGPFPEVRSLGDMEWTHRAFLKGYKLKISNNAIYQYHFKTKKTFLGKYKRIGFGMGENHFVNRPYWYIFKNLLPPSPAFVSRFWEKNKNEKMGLSIAEIIFFCWCVKVLYARGYFKYVTKR